jgi:hypothetical protein
MAKKSASPKRKRKIFRRSTEKSVKKPNSKITRVLGKMRRKGASLRQAAREAKVAPRTVIKKASSALRKSKSGRYSAKSSDRLVRPLMIPTSEGPMEIEVRGLKQASSLGRYWSALHKYFERGDKSLQKFAGQSITATDGTKYPLITDFAVLDNLGSAGVLSFESLYAGGTNA